jgi:hypothetical protein
MGLEGHTDSKMVRYGESEKHVRVRFEFDADLLFVVNNEICFVEAHVHF